MTRFSPVTHARSAGEAAKTRVSVQSLRWQVFELAGLVGRRPIGNIRKLPGGGYRLRFSRHGEMRTSLDGGGTAGTLVPAGQWR
jgi:hypothetical protein